MPELPEVETTKASLAPLIGRTVARVATSRHRLREPICAVNELVGYTLINAKRRAKYLLLTFAKLNQGDNKATDTRTLLVHLGMSGSLTQRPINTPANKHDHIIWQFDAPNNSKNGDAQPRALVYHDPRRFGIVMWADDGARYLAKLGIEPLDDAFSGDYLYHTIHGLPPNNHNGATADKAQHNISDRPTNLLPIQPPRAASFGKSTTKKPIARPIKAVIMEQAIVVGVGNIYAAESLFLSGIHPQTPANKLSKRQLSTLVHHIKTVLAHSIAVGGTTLRDFVTGDNQTGYFSQTLRVYGRENLPCPNCNQLLQNVKIAGRASVFCPACQPLIAR